MDRAGYDEHFLGVPVPLPVPSRPEVETVVLPYTHFTVVLRPDRRMAAATAVCIDGLAACWRTCHGRAAGNSIRGWTRPTRRAMTCTATTPWTGDIWCSRLDPVWGTAAEANQANEDTFHYTNAAPQADVFNQGKQLWQGLENYLLDHAADFDRKLAVLTGPVLHDSDPPYRGVQVPLRFWKVAAFLQDGALAATAYVLDQSPDLTWDAERALAGAQAGAPPPLGAFRTFQVPVKDVAELTSLDLGPLPAVDLMPVVLAPAERWKRLASYDDIMLQRG